MPLIFYEGQLLFDDGKLAFDLACCCRCCFYNGDEYVDSFVAEYGDIEILQTDFISLEGDGDCLNEGTTFTIEVSVTDQLTSDTYTTEVTIELRTEPVDGECVWDVTIPQDPDARVNLEHPGTFTAGIGCTGHQNCNDPYGDCNGFGEGNFDIIDPDGSAAGRGTCGN